MHGLASIQAYVGKTEPAHSWEQAVARARGISAVDVDAFFGQLQPINTMIT